MAICPKCSYSLVLLEKRLRYKCAKCGRLYLQKFIDDKEFLRWNQKQREFDKEGLEQEVRQREEERLRKKQEKQTIKKKRPQLSPEERRERMLMKKRIYNKRGLATYKAWLDKNREKKYAYLKDYRKSKLYESRLKQRLGFWRSEQKKLALQQIENLLCKKDN